MEDVGKGLLGRQDLTVQLQTGAGTGGGDADLSGGQDRPVGRPDDLPLLSRSGGREQTDHHGGQQGSHRRSRHI